MLTFSRDRLCLTQCLSWSSGSKKIALGELTLDVTSHRGYAAGSEIELTALEFRLLQRVQSREQVLADVWGMTSALDTRTVDTHVMRLRDKTGRRARGARNRSRCRLPHN